ncbi:hypothetical protein QBC40DRAFT_328183 [Triangularia verruculosa]|uniref:CID domain-containing protein n=1 Tax=Triangularia verruculosa TaxID=2587418 RepID=A0AAN6XI63_9PEZI|nr:hypothetical protein QBC40DRAFT_328183 [Triangularia verruculosa]
MSTNNIAEFPEVQAKLQHPKEKSAYERQKAESEAKRLREEAETAAALAEFQREFGGEEEDDSLPRSAHQSSRFGTSAPTRPAFNQGTFGGGAGKRHFGIPSGPSLKSGPGSLGPPPSSFGKKRTFDGFQQDRDRDRGRNFERSGYEDRDAGSLTVSRAFEASDDEGEPAAVSGRAEEKAASRPTLRLSNLPPGRSPAFIRSLVPSNLTVEDVKIVPPAGPTGADRNTERKSISAIVTLSKETPAAEMDAAVSALQNRYLGFGYFLSLHRHLSSAAIASGLTALHPSTVAVSHPFGAKKVEESSRSHGPRSMSSHRGYAPPTHYGPPMGGPVNRSGILHVPVAPPRDIKQLRMIHKVIESVLQHGPQLEALLMSRPDVQQEEKWAWIWDARSEGGIWYRWKLWEIVTGLQSTDKTKYWPLFEGSHAWKAPGQPLAYEYVTGVDEFVSEPEYDSSEDEDFDDEPGRQAEHNEQEDTFLNPIEKSKLSHLLARLPTTLSKTRKGDIARIATFAITHASRGADEIVEMIVSNVEQPFAYSSANPDYKRDGKGKDDDSRDVTPGPEDKTGSGETDTSAASLLGLYVVSDILSSSSTSGIRHAWRYRQLFENALRSHKTFEKLGMMVDKLGWGRFRADKWKRSVELVLSLWEGWCVFPVETHEHFVNSFNNPPALKKPAAVDETEPKAGKWKPGETQGVEKEKDNGFLPISTKLSAEQEEEDDHYLEDVLQSGGDGELQSPYMYYTSALDAFSDLDLDGVPYDTTDDETSNPSTKTGQTATEPSPDKVQTKVIGGFSMSTTKAAPIKKRMRAVDMFAGSDSDEMGT